MKNSTQPWMVSSMAELLGLARAMEREAIDGYRALAARMRGANRLELSAVFEALVREEEGHLGSVERWIENSPVVVARVPRPSPTMFDDEGAASVAPELLDAYRAFAVAVRNEQSAFVFWTYVSAHASSQEIKSAAERMAREELGHVAILRRERRRAFHDLRSGQDVARADLSALEARLAGNLDLEMRKATTADKEFLAAFAQQARQRAEHATPAILGKAVSETDLPAAAVDRLPSLVEGLLDFYLGLAEKLEGEESRRYAQACAGDLVACLHFVSSEFSAKS